MNAQQIFDAVCAHLRTQGGAARDDGLGCMYLTSDGRKCAIGIFLPEGHESQRLIGDIHALLDRYGHDLPSWMIEHRGLLASLQSVHDGIFSWGGEGFSGEGEWRLRNVAGHYGLIYEPPLPLSAKALATSETEASSNG